MAIRSVWSPVNEFVSLREAMDRLVADSFISPRTLLGTIGNTMNMPANLWETSDGYIVQVSLPGVDPEKLQVTVRGDTVTLKGERFVPTFENAQQIWNGIPTGSFEQMFTLPAAVESGEAHASYEHGLLTLRLPKAQHARSHTIKVVSGKEQGQKVLEPTSK
jgi:HSP20 family protein